MKTLTRPIHLKPQGGGGGGGASGIEQVGPWSELGGGGGVIRGGGRRRCLREHRRDCCFPGKGGEEVKSEQ
ncbi:unnamed protein product [Spirodela intermedia]|uniref:Uncharacterized protein n=1 Tax=Spirodela intermedia TaxID=51605 RepID=A0A7I8JSE3_SPIIN|nr:unnamed protein product [Spirodela intermedia]CAA6673127.1 unnamed protein product [Spirodela intermedia]